MAHTTPPYTPTTARLLLLLLRQMDDDGGAPSWDYLAVLASRWDLQPAAFEAGLTELAADGFVQLRGGEKARQVRLAPDGLCRAIVAHRVIDDWRLPSGTLAVTAALALAAWLPAATASMLAQSPRETLYLMLSFLRRKDPAEQVARAADLLHAGLQASTQVQAVTFLRELAKSGPEHDAHQLAETTLAVFS